jgi:hypothetical protein
MLTTQFLLGQKPKIRAVVKMQLPDSVAKASVQEWLLDKSKRTITKWMGAKSWNSQEKGEQKSSFSPSEMWKTRQLKKYMRTNGMCYKCGDNFVSGHKCSVTPPVVPVAQLAAIVDSGQADGGGIISNQMLEVLEDHAMSTEADCHISLYALSGAAHNKAIHLRALIGNHVLSILLDSGSSNTFINSTMLSKIPNKAVPAPTLRVKVANGQVIHSTTVTEPPQK